jgi:hypothetical protein
MAKAFCDYLYTNPDEYIGTINYTDKDNCLIIYNGAYLEKSKRSVPDNAIFPSNSCSFSIFNNKQMEYNHESDIDFIQYIHNEIENSQKSIIVVDKNDMALLSLLYHSIDFKHNIYLSKDLIPNYGIDIKALKKKWELKSNNKAMTSFKNFLFLLPLAFLTGIPNSISMVLPSMVIDLFTNINKARSRILKDDNINLISFNKMIDYLSSSEKERTNSIVSKIQKGNIYNPMQIDEKNYAEMYYEEFGILNGFIMDKSRIVKLVFGYIRALYYLHRYLSCGEIPNAKFTFVDSPLLSTIYNVMSNVKDELYKIEKIDYQYKNLNTRTLNRKTLLIL